MKPRKIALIFRGIWLSNLIWPGLTELNGVVEWQIREKEALCYEFEPKSEDVQIKTAKGVCF